MSEPIPGRRFWLLRLVPPGRWGRWICGTSIFTLLLAAFLLSGSLSLTASGQSNVSLGIVVFFCIILGYIVPIHHLIIERSLLALRQLQPALDASSDQVESWRNRIQRKTRRWHAISLSMGFLAGFLHNALLITGTELAQLFASIGNLLPAITTMLVWIVMTCVISSLIDTSLLFRQLAQRVQIELFNVRALTPIGSVAVSSTLAMIGAQAAFPAMFLASDAAYVTYLPGLIATGVPMLFLFLLPVWPIHRRISRSKRAQLDRVARDLSVATATATDASGADRYLALQPLLVYRREVGSVSEWPFDNSVMGRLALYLIIPPLTWVGAALIEILIDTAL